MDNFDFYIKNTDQETYQSDQLATNSIIEGIISKLQLVLLGNKGSVIGDYDMGADLEHYIWNTFVSNDNIKEIITEQINKYIPEMYTIGFTINVYFEKGLYRDACMVDIEMPGEGVQILFQ
jgi:uncharacterized Fe-S cluster-containing MiaB family protein